MQAKPKLCDAGVQCNIGLGEYQKRESAPDTVEEEIFMEEEVDSDDKDVSFAELLSPLPQDVPV